MAKLTLNEAKVFAPISEGYHVFKIVESNYKEDFGKLEIVMKTANGQKHIERFSFGGGKFPINQGAMNAFSYFARVAMNDYSMETVDPSELVGKYLRCKVEHDVKPHRDDPNKTVTFIRLTEKLAADGYEETEKVAEKPATNSTKVDLDALLG